MHVESLQLLIAFRGVNQGERRNGPKRNWRPDQIRNNAANYPGVVAPLARVSTANACSNDAESNIDGLNTICFNQSSMAFTAGVLAFTRVITANAPGASVGSGPAAEFAGQILDADTLFRND